MYIPELFKNHDIEEVKDFINKNAFAILVTGSENKIVATHIPLILSKNKAGRDILLGHISKANEQLKTIDTRNNVLAIFQGPHSYISSSWYHHENVPTWNYIAVHIYGTIKIIEGEELFDALSQLVDKFEAGSEKPVSVHKMSEGLVKKEMKGIIGFAIAIESIEAVKKLSQNRDDKNHANIITELEKKKDVNSNEIAREMKKNRNRANNND